VTLGTSATSPPGRLRLPGLDPDATYDLRPLAPGDGAGHGDAIYPVPWWTHGTRLSGRTLAAVGVQAPSLFPERLVLLHARRAPSGPSTD
jgi:alpha-galactosidase